MRHLCRTGSIICLVTLVAGSSLWAQDLASTKREQASPQRILQSLRQGDRDEALEYYRALVNKTKQLHAPSLRRICEVVIREALENNSVDVRIQAARALAHAVDADTVPLVLEVLRRRKVPEQFIIEEPFLPVRSEGLLPLLKRALEDEDRMVRIWAVHALAEIGGPQVVEPLSEALDDPFLWVRLQAVLGLGRLRPELIPKDKIRPLCDDPSPVVALDAVAVLVAHGEENLGPRLREMLTGNDPYLGRHFAVVAEVLKASALEDPLMSLLENDIAPVRMRAAQALGRLKVTRSFSRLMGLLSDSDLPVRAAAAQALGELGNHQAAGELERLAATSTGPLKVAAVSALGKFDSAAMLVALRRALLDDDSAVRLAAAQSLGHIKNEQVIPLLQAVYTSREETASVRAHAAVSAARLGDYRAVVQLNTDARDEEPYVRMWAAWGLGEVGRQAQLFTVVNLLVDQDEMVRSVSARAALKLSNRLEKAESDLGPEP